MRRSFICLAAVSIIGVWHIAGCGSSEAPLIGDIPDGGDLSDATFGDGANVSDGSTITLGGDAGVCKSGGATCASNGECCSSACDPTAKKCAVGVGAGNCKAAGAACGSSTDCCNLTCVSGTCGAAACTPDKQACSSGAACCGGVCTNGTCAPLNTTCGTAGNTCTDNAGCCSKLCQGGICQIASSYCVQTGDVCSDGSSCCGGVCTKATGATLGTCGVPPGGGTNCGGGIDGVVCGACNDCCSRVCAPFLTGVKICQPANGCHIEGDLCAKTSDCCGGDTTTGLPGNGNVTCEIAAGFTIGVCRTPTSGTDAGNGACNPEGNVCHYKNYVCGSSSAEENNCCLHLGSKTDCDLDKLGIPRCHVVGGDGGVACRAGGQACAFTDDCCNGAPCVPGPSGTLECYAGPSGGGGGAVCVPTSGPCTINGDCCTSNFCNVLPGSTKGTCDAIPVSGGGGGGTGGGGDGGTTADGGSAGGGGTGTSCSLYGQSCTTAANCCNAVPCTGTDGFDTCGSGQIGCTCVYATPR